ncbi:hypothetical protein ACQ4PT_032897 [Festuca glaucescens]
MEMELAGRADEAMEEFVVDVENTAPYSPLAEAEKAQWVAHCIYRVPARIKNLEAGPHVYKPHTVSIGPFHHGDPELVPMEGHKHRALQHVARRAGKTAGDFIAAMEEVAEQLESAYMDLGDDWRGDKRGCFLQVMVTDGCFLLEIMRTAAGENVQDYAVNDPVFGPHGQQYTVPCIREDMHKVENQLPLLVLKRIVDVESKKKSVNEVNMMVLEFMSSSSGSFSTKAADQVLGLHPLDICRQSKLFDSYMEVLPPSSTPGSNDGVSSRFSAVKLYKAGIKFARSNPCILEEIEFDSRRGLLTMPYLEVDDTTEHMLLNMMAFEYLHVTATYGVTRYVLFMEEIIKSAKDVKRLRKEGMVRNNVGPDEEVARMFNRLTKNVIDDPLHNVLQQMDDYLGHLFRRQVNKCWGHFVHTYFHKPLRT